MFGFVVVFYVCLFVVVFGVLCLLHSLSQEWSAWLEERKRKQYRHLPDSVIHHHIL